LLRKRTREKVVLPTCSSTNESPKYYFKLCISTTCTSKLLSGWLKQRWASQVEN